MREGMMVHSAQGRSVPTEIEATDVVAGHTFTGSHIISRLRQAADAQRKGFTVPISPNDVLWLLHSHELLLCCAEDSLEYVANFEDMRDGDYGAPEPNEAMQLANSMRTAIAEATA